MKLFGSFSDRRAISARASFPRRSHERPGNGPRNVVANIKYVVHLPVISVGPELAPRARIDQLRRYTHVLIGTLDTAFNDVVNTELLTDLPDIRSLVLICQRELRAMTKEIGKLGQPRDQLLGDSVGKVLLVPSCT